MISVIIPVYNGALFLKEAVESVVNQNCNDLEIIMIDDGSTDNTKEVIQSLPYPNITYIHQENGGPSKARNTGLKRARNEYITFLDADDTWPLKKLQVQLDILANDPSIDVVSGLTQYNFMPGSEYRKPEYNVLDPVFNVQLGAMLIRRKVIDTIGYFNEELRFSEDQDWLLRMRENNISIHILKQVMLLYRIHPGNVTKHKTTKDLGILKSLKLSLDRRRNSGLGNLSKL